MLTFVYVFNLYCQKSLAHARKETGIILSAGFNITVKIDLSEDKIQRIGNEAEKIKGKYLLGGSGRLAEATAWLD